MHIDSLMLGMGIAAFAFGAEFIDSTLGMGYGTTLTPLLLLIGFEPMQVVPAVLLSELLTGVSAGAAHHLAGNVDFSLRSQERSVVEDLKALGYVETARRRLSPHMKIAILIGGCSVLGTLVAVFAAMNISKFALKLYIAVMVLAIGVFILVPRKAARRFSWGKVMGLGIVASFNKALSGGGYGPVVTGGQILSGVESRNAVAITSVAEALTCAVAFGTYLAVGGVKDWGLMPFLCVGALLSVPVSALAVKRISSVWLTRAVGATTFTLGALMLIQLLDL